MSEIKPVAYMFDHTIKNDKASITMEDRTGIVNPLIMEIKGFSSINNIRPLYSSLAIEALKAENVDQKKRIAELEEKNGALRERIKKLEAQHKYRDHMDTVKF